MIITSGTTCRVGVWIILIYFEWTEGVYVHPDAASRAEGVRVGTTEAYMRQPGMASATPVSLMLSQFSRVEAYRNGQLLKTYFLDAGVQNLDTRGCLTASILLSYAFLSRIALCVRKRWRLIRAILP